MSDGLELAGHSERTQKAYVARSRRKLAEHDRKSPRPDRRREELRRDRQWSVFDIARPAREARLPVVLSREEVQTILAGGRIAVYRLCLVAIYTCGLRLREGTHLRPADIDGERQVVHVCGKGRRDRIVPIPERTLVLLRESWKTQEVFHTVPVSVIADIFREAGGAYCDRFGDRMLPSHRRVLRDVVQCCTPALGGHLYRCDECQRTEYVYHSCRNRHCPTCRGDRSPRWAEAQKQRLLPCPYFLLTFTVPESLRPLAGSHQREVYDLLLRCAAASIQKLALDPKYLGGRPGMVGVLHTWTRDLRHHPHVHFLVTAGGLTEDGLGWRKSRRPGFLMPGRVLSVVFRAGLREALERHGLSDAVPKKAWKQKWVVHVQDAGTGETLIEYLGRYLFRPPISNQSIERFEAGRVTFRYRDGRSRQLRRTTLGVDEFLRRFLLHVLPRGFTRVRHYGCFSPGSARKLALARSLLEGHEGTAPTAPTNPNEPSPARLDPERVELAAEAIDAMVEGEDTASTADRSCPFCGTGTMRRIAEIARVPIVPIERSLQRAPP